MSYRFLDHIADVKFIAEANSIENLFIECSNALKESICGKITILEQDEKNIEIKGNSLENLLYKFLEEILILLESKDFVFSKIYELKIDENSFILKAKIKGDKVQNYKFTNDVKAITYSEMKIEENKKKNSWKTTVVLDV